MAGSKGTNPTLLMAECLHCFESGTRKVHVARCSSHARCVKLGLWLRARCSGRRTLGASLSPNRTGGFFSKMLHEDHKSSQSEKKRCLCFQKFSLIPAGKGAQSPRVLFRNLVAEEFRKMAGRRRAKDCYSRFDIVETIKVLQHAMAEA